MKTILTVAALVVFGATGALAQSSRPASPAYNWSGWYIGVNGGYGWANGRLDATPNDPAAGILFPGGGGFGSPEAPFARVSKGGGFGGAQVGYTWQQTPHWVAGLEADFQGGSIKARGSNVQDIGSGVFAGIFKQTEAEMNLQWFGTVRGRIGYLATNSLMLYGTAGIAVGGIRRSASFARGVESPSGLTVGFLGFGFVCVDTIPCIVGTRTAAELGVVAGAGAEWMVAPNVSVKAEYTYLYFGKPEVTAVALNYGASIPASINASIDTHFHLARIGVNYHFK